jgi:3-hydroxybutyryl-CoA dehydrogenase
VTRVAQLSTVGVIGGGTMGVGIAFVFAQAGAAVTVVEPDAQRARAAKTTVADRAAKADRQIADINVISSISELPLTLDLIIEAVPEDLELKLDVLAQAERRVPTILATNTSALSIASLAGSLRRPQALIGLHFFNPVWTMPLLEIIRGASTSPELVAAAKEIGTFIGKETIVVWDSPGFATSRLGVALGLEAIRMFEEGVASAEDIDRAMVLGCNHPMGPLRLTDLVGLDVRLAIARRLRASLGPRFEPPALLVDLVERRHLGKKAGRGFYKWDAS